MKNFVSVLMIIGLFFSLQVHADVAEKQAKQSLSLGLLSFQPQQQVKNQWQPLIHELNDKLEFIQIELKVLNYEQLHQSVAHRDIDFVLINSGSYIELAHSHGLSSPLVSLINQQNQQPIRGFGGVILVRNERTDLLDLQDLKHKKIATPSRSSLGGYMVQAFELMQIGLKMPQSVTLIETDMPHANAIDALLANEVDAAFVRTGILESLIEKGQLDADQLRVLNLQSLPSFEFALSTRLYPEWPLAAMTHVDMAYAGQLAGALLALPYNTKEMQTAGIYGFSIPADYEPVRELMRSLHLPPYHIKTKITWADIWQSHQNEIMAASTLLLVIVLLVFVLLILNRRLIDNISQLKQKEDDLRIAAVAFETQEAILITDAEERIVRVNQAFTDITGFNSDEVVGKTPRIFKSGLHDEEFYQLMWDDIKHKDGWRGEIWNRRKDGEIYPEYQSITTIKNPKNEVTHYLSTFNDITIRKNQEEQIHKLAFFDPLTGLANRRLLEDHIELALSSNRRYYHHCALLFIDLDHFKNLNDTLGHKLGDELLKQVAERLRASVREGDTVARPGGDEFIILLQNLSIEKNEAIQQARKVGEKILEGFNSPFHLSESQYILTASIGVNLFFEEQDTVEELMKRSDLAMYQAKAEGRNGLRFFDPALQEAATRRSELENDLRIAIQQQQFELYYQPKVNLEAQVCGYEALIRWNHPLKGRVSPIDFIPIAEETGLILDIGDWVIKTACQTLFNWQQNPQTQHLTLAINISERQFQQENFISRITHWIDTYKINPNKFEIELTESLLMENTEDCIDKMKALRVYGIEFSLDDFGTGYSSLSYLKNLPLSCLKIDQSFVRDMLDDPNDAAIVETIVALAKTLDLTVTAEGVETEQQSAKLAELGCELLQGYLYGRPAPLSEQ